MKYYPVMILMLMAGNCMAEMTTAERFSELMLGLKILSIPLMIVLVPTLLIVIIVKSIKASSQVAMTFKREMEEPSVSSEEKRESLLDALEGDN